MCDFQYLPVVDDPSGNKSCVYSDLVPSGVVGSDWLNEPAPLFLPPATFSRMDIPQAYWFRSEETSGLPSKVPKNVICQVRQKRTIFACLRSFKDPVPTQPLPGAMAHVKVKFLEGQALTQLKQKFEERPIWSRNALRVCLDGFSENAFKYLIPVVAFYYTSGPWRNLWVRFGYDPRKNPASWLYQSFDYRVKQSAFFKTKVVAKRNYSSYNLPYKSTTTKKKSSMIVSSLLTEESKDKTEAPGQSDGDAANVTAAVASGSTRGSGEEIYLFRPGLIPPCRQMFYQYCDLHVPEIQTFLEESILAGANKVCHPKHGWLPSEVEAHCRTILTSIIEATISQKNAEEPSGSGELDVTADDTVQANVSAEEHTGEEMDDA